MEHSSIAPELAQQRTVKDYGEAALFYAALGWRVHPLRKNDKRPRLVDWPNLATTDPDKIDAWWRKWPSANIGVATGAASGIVVVDIDPRHGGDVEWEDLIDHYGRPPDTVEQITGSGGRHLIYACDEELPTRDIGGQGLTLKAEGGFVVVAPSVHPNGRRYEWEVLSHPGDICPAPLPQWIRELVREKARRTAPAVVFGPPVGAPDLSQWPLRGETLALIHNHPGPRRDGVDRSANDQRVITALVGAGASDDEIRAVFESFPIGTGHYADAGAHKERYLMTSIQSARGYVGAQPAAPVAVRAAAPPPDVADDVICKVTNERGQQLQEADDELCNSTKVSVIQDDELCNSTKLTGADGEAPTERKAPTTADYIDALQRLGYRARMNELDDAVEVNGERLSDALRAEILMRMRDRGFKGVQVVDLTLTAWAYRNRYHPIRDYLEAREWDGGRHIDALADYLTFPDHLTDISRAFLRRWLIGAVAKVYRGTFNPALVLDGRQGLGKSFLAEWLCPPALRRYFIESSIRPDDKDHHIALATNWIWEVGELQATTRRADREALKHFISLREIKVRPAYGRHPMVKPALASFIGTINESGAGFLDDPTGTRRFLVLKLEDINWYYSTLNVNQIWAEASVAYRAGEKGTLSADEDRQRRLINAGYEQVSNVAEFFFACYAVDSDDLKWHSTQEIMNHLEGKGLKGNQQANMNKLGELLSNVEGVSKERPRIDGKRVTAYRGLRELA